MSVENKSVDINSKTHEAIKYCVEYGAKMSKRCEFAPPRLRRNSDLNLKFAYNFCCLYEVLNLFVVQFKC